MSYTDLVREEEAYAQDLLYTFLRDIKERGEYDSEGDEAIEHMDTLVSDLKSALYLAIDLRDDIARIVEEEKEKLTTCDECGNDVEPGVELCEDCLAENRDSADERL